MLQYVIMERFAFTAQYIWVGVYTHRECHTMLGHCSQQTNVSSNQNDTTNLCTVTMTIEGVWPCDPPNLDKKCPFSACSMWTTKNWKCWSRPLFLKILSPPFARRGLMVYNVGPTNPDSQILSNILSPCLVLWSNVRSTYNKLQEKVSL